MTRGVLMYAHNNTEIDYFKVACANALMVQKNLKVPITVVTDIGTLDWAKTSLGEDFINQCFEKIIVVKLDSTFVNKRAFSDSTASKTLQFYNCNHWAAYELTPYDETLFIDADYLIMSNELGKCWNNNSEIMINGKIFNPGDTKDPYYKFIDEFGIKQYWATVIYFRKSEYAKFLFDSVRHIQENYAYYKQLYCFSNGMFRNDYAFSIAIHMLNGFSDTNSGVVELPITGLLMSWDTHDIHSVNGLNDLTIFCEKPDKGQYLLARIKNQDIHIMNKWAINRISDQLIELYK